MIRVMMKGEGEDEEKPKYGLLNEKDITPGLLYLFANVQKVLPLLPKYAIHLGVVRDHHLILHLTEKRKERQLARTSSPSPTPTTQPKLANLTSVLGGEMQN